MRTAVLLLAACATPPARGALPELPLPEARHGHRIELVGGGLLAFGGFAASQGRTSAVRRTYWLAPGATAWQRRADMKTGRSFFGSAVVDGVVYAVGDGVERYDFDDDRWLEVAPAEGLPHSHFAVAAVGRELFVLGGFPESGSGFSIVDIDAGTVRAAEPPPGFARGDHFHFLFEFDGQLHVIGGLGSSMKRGHWLRDVDRWRALPAPPVAMWSKFGGGAVVDGALYLFGDFGGYRYRPGAGWQPRRSWGGMLGLSAIVAVGGELRAIGGLLVGEESRAVLRIYEPDRDSWRAVGR